MDACKSDGLILPMLEIATEAMELEMAQVHGPSTDGARTSGTKMHLNGDVNGKLEISSG